MSKAIIARSGISGSLKSPSLYAVISSPPGEGRESLIDSIERLAQESRIEINSVEDVDQDRFFFSVKNIDQFLPMILRRTRLAKKLSIGEVTKRLGHSSRNSYAQYEYGKTKLTFAKYLELVAAMDPQAKIVLSTLQ